LAADAKRVETWAKQAEVTAAVAAHALNPLAAPVAQQADLTPAKPMTEVSQEIQREQEKDWAQHELQRLKREAADLPQVRRSDRVQTRRAASRQGTQQPRRSRER
jgi:hypothetical protein